MEIQALEIFSSDLFSWEWSEYTVLSFISDPHMYLNSCQMLGTSVC